MNYQTYKKQITDIFVRTKQVSCPAFQDEVIFFNAKGINRLLFKGNRSQRDSKRIETNIRLLPRAIYLLKNATFWQEENKEEQNGEMYHYWAFEAVVEERRIKVIIRQVGNGKKHFWSAIPAWRRDRFGIVNAKNRNLEK